MWSKQKSKPIQELANQLSSESNTALQARIEKTRWKIAHSRSAHGLEGIVFAMAIEATRRIHGKVHFPVQIHAALEMSRRKIVQMQTGEGKTLTAILPVVLRAMHGKGMHVITANEYLAERDCDSLRGVYEFMGLTTAVVTAKMDDNERRKAYACDITYSTAGEIGFDFLRDQLRAGQIFDWEIPSIFQSHSLDSAKVHRDFQSALIDEADGILIDDARTPLVIGSERLPRPEMQSLFHWCQSNVSCLRHFEHYLINFKKKTVDMTELGCRWISTRPKPRSLDSLSNETIFKHVEKAVTANVLYLRDRDYIVSEQHGVCIVDEGTGRVMEERKWQQGLHQAIEAKEEIAFSPESNTAAQVTVQTLFRRYPWLCGMTGTAVQVRRELRRVYKTRVATIPTNRPCQRLVYPDRVFLNNAAKYVAVCVEIEALVKAGRSVLVGTPSVEASQALSQELISRSIFHEVLNCNRHMEEAEIVSLAGHPGKVTVATNMAGRGTDILLHEDVKRQGGLHVIGTQRHSSSRIDRQLVGRCARQGDPGSARFFLGLEDEILNVLSVRQLRILQIKAAKLADSNGELPASYCRIHRRSQRQLEIILAKDRKSMLKRENEKLKSYVGTSVNPFVEMLLD
jgi:preprotein translocase subunit SecA